MFQVAKWSGCRDMGQKLHFFEVFWLFREIQEGIPGIFLAHNHPRNLLNIFALELFLDIASLRRRYDLKLRTHIGHTSILDELIIAIVRMEIALKSV